MLSGDLNEVEHAHVPTPPKRGRGRPRGSKQKTSPSTVSRKTSTSVINQKMAPSTAKLKNAAASTTESVDNDTVETQSNSRRKRPRLTQDAVADLDGDVEVPVSSPPHHQDVDMVDQHPEDPSDYSKSTPAKKMMRLKPGGRLASPLEPPLVPAREEHAPAKKPAARGRKRKERHLLVVCRYATDSEIGSRIHRILNNEERHVASATTGPLPAATIKPRPQPLNTHPSKPTHPFFSAKPKPVPPANVPPSATTNPAENQHRTSAVTPGKLRAQRQNQRTQDADNAPIPLPFPSNRDRMITKQPGMTQAPWPWKHLAHVRGDFSYHTRHHSSLASNVTSTAPLSRKMKHTLPIIEPSESLLTHYSQTLDFHQDDSVRPDGFRDPPASLRVPTRSLISSSKIQVLVYNQLHESSSMHPACAALYDSVPSAMTPYDHGRSEVQSWAQKYAPICSEDVLQPGREPAILRDWTKALTVMAVNGFASTSAKQGTPDPRQKKKRRKKVKELDDFIVSSDEECNDMSEITAHDDLVSSQGSASQKPSVVQAQARGSKLSNVILISGPSGCGKSAMVHAIAKELSFEVFEINPGSRRSGKDVLDRVGDMVENHLVQRNSADTGSVSADEDAGRLSEAFKADLVSGRQGTMASFFSSKPKKSSASNKHVPKLAPKQQKAQQTLAKPQAPRSQKQSLILLEEVDVLFEEDRGFWQTVITLVANSKRPVIMTCNDEDLVPIQTMRMHAILRLTPPSPTVASDYMLLIAANEGHVLPRDAVDTLYESKQQDLRASIADLQLWCQMGVGDPRGGLGWMFQRWPKGTGVDANGLPVRVTSHATYQSGMGFLPYGPTNFSDGNKEEVLLHAWENWGVDPRARLFDRIDQDVQRVFAHKNDQIEALLHYERLSEVMSAMDMYSSIGLPGSTHIDVTDPPLPVKSRSDYTTSMSLLETPPVVDYVALSTRLAITTTRLAANVCDQPLDTSLQTLLSDITASDPHTSLTRSVFSSALEPLAFNPSLTFMGPSLTYTTLDGPFKPIVMDVAPYVRSIAAFDLGLEAQRARMNEGDGSEPKRMRTTRAARSALEGGQRSLTRRERWFNGLDLDLNHVLGTGGVWPRLGRDQVDDDASNTVVVEL